MALTMKQKSLVTDSFAKVAPIADTAAELFYARLFKIDSSTKPLFESTNMNEQGRKLMETLGTAVGALYTLDAIVPFIEDLGKRHIKYGVKKEQYDSVGQALIWTLEQGLGNDFTPETKEAWVAVYGVLAGVATSAYETEDAPHEA